MLFYILHKEMNLIIMKKKLRIESSVYWNRIKKNIF